MTNSDVSDNSDCVNKSDEPKKKLKKNVKISTNAEACRQNEATIRERSRFHHHYEQVKNDQISLIVEINKDNLINEINPYYSLEFIKLISSYMYIAPLWSSLMNKAMNNNPSETNFRIGKHTTLDHLKNMPRTIVSQFQLRIASQAILYELSSVSYLNKFTPITIASLANKMLTNERN